MLLISDEVFAAPASRPTALLLSEVLPARMVLPLVASLLRVVLPLEPVLVLLLPESSVDLLPLVEVLEGVVTDVVSV